MIVASDFNRLAPSERAAVIYAQARSDFAARLWRAALGSGASGEAASASVSSFEPAASGLDSLLAMITKTDAPILTEPRASFRVPVRETHGIALSSPGPVDAAVHLGSGLGPNARFAPTLSAAATRTSIPAAALAAIVDAEAAKGRDGGWRTTSRNPRSSAAGLGQFLAGTWQSEAERAGTWLNETARSQGWLGADGRVLPAARATLLALRYDGDAAIQATADYAQRSVTLLKRAGVPVGEDVTTLARTAYLGHHLGTGDAVRFLTGGLSDSRARRLLDAQIGSAATEQRIARTGDATSAHRAWLLAFVDRHIKPARFTDR
ncbi:MAG: peptidoglycan-binding protein [Sphingomonadaceae bacterium]